MTETRQFVAELNEKYERLHTAKEDAFWTAYMGLLDDPGAAQLELNRCEIELKAFLQGPSQLASVRTGIERAEAALDSPSSDNAPTPDDMVALAGWLATFEANVIESAEARELAVEIIGDEGRLAQARGAMRLGYEDPENGFVEASSVKLAVMVATDEDEARRRAAWDGLRSIEPVVLENDFLGIVKKRNRLGRLIGGEDYYDATVLRNEGMSKRDVFDRLDELEEQTRDAARRFIDELRDDHGDLAVNPWSVTWLVSGDVTAEQDPYFPFSKSVERWGRSFAALGVDYKGAELVLDLVDRKGKYENGFMHGPVPAWRDQGTFRPARIQFTANGIPGMIGAGRSATQTLFHEGGHAAHFANNDMPAPCFSQEFAPSSVAFAETQSMFLDSLLGDADWQARYARTEDGDEMPIELIEKGIRARQPSAAWKLRSMLSVCYAEKAIYEIPDDELTRERVIDEVRAVERRLLFLDEGSPRPTLAVPHLLAGESSAYYHGYVLAQMAVHQTRDFFLNRDGHLVDNPNIGRDLRESYWKPGNSLGFLDLVERLTGKPLSAQAIADDTSLTADEAVERARAAIARLAEVNAHDGTPALDARIRVMHGNETVAVLDGDFGAFATRFEEWIGAE